MNAQPEPVNWATNFHADDVSTWVALGEVTQPACCENGWLPLPDGSYIKCWRCDAQQTIEV